MKIKIMQKLGILSVFTIAVLVFSLVGCENSFNHKPPTGMGSLIVNNQTGDRLDVFIGGVETNSVRYYDYKAYDLDPGVHRVVLMQRNGSHSYRDDVDILNGQRTVMRVSRDGSYGYQVRVYFD